jgi:hypothetical protein
MNRETFNNPPNILRSAPFWSWNDNLQNTELERQAMDMSERGWGGYFMHSRVGLITPYLGEDWLDRIRHTVEMSAREGLKAYLYDEDKWPSGYAGGIVTRDNPEYRSCALQCTPERPTADSNELVAVFVRRTDESGVTGWARVEEESQVRAGDDVRFVSVWTEPMGNPWFNGATYTDLMNPEAVQAFINSTLEPYAELVGEHFGEDKAIPGLFTDEPSYMFWNTVDNVDRTVTVPWTLGFIEAFRERWDYDILDEAVALFEPTDHHQTVRYHFWRTATELYLEAFSEPYGKWCRDHNLQLTGHYMLEDNLQGQIRWIGAAMPHYEHMGWPGMDHLCRNIDDSITARQVTSVANQLGKERTLSELYGCSGHNLSFEGRKWIADWHFIHGINLINPHLSLYTMRGERKRDYPPTISYQQPWWQYNNIVADYCARVSYALTQGRRVPQVLVIHPIESAWCVFQPDDEGGAADLNTSFDDVTKWLLESHYDFDYADESLLAKYGKVAGDGFCVGEAEYEIIIIPPGVTLRSSTLRLLSEWMSDGGSVISVKPIPRSVDGLPPDEATDDAWDLLRDTIVVEQYQEEFIGALAEMVPPSVQVLSPEGFPVAPVWFHERYVSDPSGDDSLDYSIYFFANTDATRGYDCTIVLTGSGEIELWDPKTGEVEPVAAERAGTHVLIEEHIDAAGSRLYIQRHGEDDAEVLDEPEAEREAFEQGREHNHAVPMDEIELDGTWRVTRNDPNVVTLDMAAWRFADLDAEQGGGPLPNPLQLIDEPEDEDDGWMESAHPWIIADTVREHTGEFELEFSLNVETEPDGEVFLVVETPEAFAISVNDEPVAEDDAGWWVDQTFRKRSITGMLNSGENTIKLRGTATQDIELESVYVIGDFGVWTEDAQEFTIDREMTDSPGGDLVEQGFPFYAGSVTLEQRIDLSLEGDASARLVIDGLAATVADVWINGENAGQIVWGPFELDISKHLKDGRNTVRIDLVNTLRNLLGPHHHQRGELHGVGPESFRDQGNWTDIYQMVAYGMSGVRIVVES